MYLGTLPKFLCCFDTETSSVNKTGSDLSAGCQVVSLGALIVDSETFEAVDTLYVEIKWDGVSEWSAGAENVHGLSRAYLEANGVTTEEAAYQFLSLIVKWMGPNPKVMPICHKPQFDIDFVNRMISSMGCELNWDSVRIDTAALGACLLGVTGSNVIFEAMGFDARGAHNALDDAVMTLAAAKQFRDIFNKGVGACTS